MKNPMMQGCVAPPGHFVFAIHRPAYAVVNLRRADALGVLGHDEQGGEVLNKANFPLADIREEGARWIHEVRNALPFRGTTYIDSGRAERMAADPSGIRLAPPPACSLRMSLGKNDADCAELFARLPVPVLHGLAASSTDPVELAIMARQCCALEFDPQGCASGLGHHRDGRGRTRPLVRDPELFEALANNPHLPEDYRRAMVLRPGIQGGSEIVGDFQDGHSHALEYLRRNSYIPWGHYAANMADDAPRYSAAALVPSDLAAMRHLYYQRVYVQLAWRLGIPVPRRRGLDADELEDLRRRLVAALEGQDMERPATLWGWNLGFDFSGSGYRLHASHQQVHMQYALVPEHVEGRMGDQDLKLEAFAVGDLVADWMARYWDEHGRDFFGDYLAAIRANQRMDDRDGPRDLVVWQDARVMLFAPKAQVSQWELQLITLGQGPAGPVGNVVEADAATRASLDRGLYIAQKVLAGLGARMVTSIEYSKRIGTGDTGQRLVLALLPKLPWAMGGFTEAQLRFISGHYPEDFAAACRAVAARDGIINQGPSTATMPAKGRTALPSDRFARP